MAFRHLATMTNYRCCLSRRHGAQPADKTKVPGKLSGVWNEIRDEGTTVVLGCVRKDG